MRIATITGRLALVLLGILLTLLVLEGSLQVAAWVIRASGRDVSGEWLTGNRRILCLGDSNTYGLYLDRNETYPHQLEALWNETIPSPKVEVLNLGFPGTNSSRLLRDFPRMLATLRPDTILVLIGANDFWTVPVSIESHRAENPLRQALGLSRVYKLFYMLRRARLPSDVEITFAPDAVSDGPANTPCSSHRTYGDHPFGVISECSGTARYAGEQFELGWKMRTPQMDVDSSALRRNLMALARQTASFGAELILLNYPSRTKFYGDANGIISRVARETGAPLIDLAAAFERDCPDASCRGLLFPDGHPTAQGYHRVAQAIVGRLADAPSGESAASPADTPSAARPPNILFLIADELRSDALGFAGHPIVKTPRLDQLARESIYFAKAYSAAPICSPTRATLFTGQYPQVHGVVDNDMPLARSQIGLPELLRRHGYATAIAGKLHLLYGRRDWFDYERVTMGGSGDAYREFLRERMPELADRSDTAAVPGTLIGPPRTPFRIGTSPLPEQLSEEAWVADRAIDFLTRQKRGDRPWFLFVSMNRPHSPFVIPEPYATMYEPQDIVLPRTFQPGGELPEGPGVNPRHSIVDAEILRQVIAHYYGAVTMVDAQLGRVLDALDELGMRDSTIVVFTSDHGNMLGERNLMFKTIMYEASTRVPLLIRAPRKLDAGKVVAAPNDHASIVPTLLELSGLPIPDEIQGRSLVVLARGDRSGVDDMAFSVFREGMVVWRRWKLIDPDRGLVPQLESTAGPELYDLEDDPDEQHNLYGRLEVAEVQERLEGALSDWWSRGLARAAPPKSATAR